MSQPLRSLSVAVATGRLSAVFLEGGVLLGWAQYRTAGRSPEVVAARVSRWIKGFGPDHLILEDPAQAGAKGARSREILGELAELCADADALDLRVVRQQAHPNKYAEASALAAAYPAIAAILPAHCPAPPPIWRSEARVMTSFEALALYHQIRG